MSKSFAQSEKSAIDTSIFNKWPFVRSTAFNDDGSYILYIRDNIFGKGRTLVVQSSRDKWKIEYSGVANAGFVGNGKLVVFRTITDSLIILQLGAEDMGYSIPDVVESRLPESEEGDWVAYRTRSSKQELILHHLFTREEKRFSAVIDYQFNKQGSAIVLQCELKRNPNLVYSLQWVHLSDNKIQEIGDGAKASFFSFDTSGNRLLFIKQFQKDSLSDNSIWYYQDGMKKAIAYVNNQSPGIDSDLAIANSIAQFSQGGDQVFFRLQPKEMHEKKSIDNIQVDVWSYMDVKVQSQQLLEVNSLISYMAVINSSNNNVIRLEQEDEKLFKFNSDNNNHFALVIHSRGQFVEFSWNRAAQPFVYLLSTKTGERKLLRGHLKTDAEYLALSPGGRWVIYYDQARKNYFSYETATGTWRNITKCIPTNWIRDEADIPGLDPASLTWRPWQKTWIANDSLVLIYDNYDIWQIDPSCTHPPVNITNYYGRVHHIEFKILFEESSLENM
ncbi:MAG TPA: hypothetical protein VK588_13615, partial [Chitinophagaceae bacterium]|nr:hypothetical protein [Chitinophagaceae bacterium]